jgi:hypothetical protein
MIKSRMGNIKLDFNIGRMGWYGLDWSGSW